ncbi:hypothetical protein SK128_005015 [Halocaridina rubra]|uniref:Uncharacterized protein n=1 Tax=Halocaridina rubra TaxID=373956 RepID=A0AAN8X7P6_HALRR
MQKNQQKNVKPTCKYLEDVNKLLQKYENEKKNNRKGNAKKYETSNNRSEFCRYPKTEKFYSKPRTETPVDVVAENKLKYNRTTDNALKKLVSENGEFFQYPQSEKYNSKLRTETPVDIEANVSPHSFMDCPYLIKIDRILAEINRNVNETFPKTFPRVSNNSHEDTKRWKDSEEIDALYGLNCQFLNPLANRVVSETDEDTRNLYPTRRTSVDADKDEATRNMYLTRHTSFLSTVPVTYEEVDKKRQIRLNEILKHYSNIDSHRDSRSDEATRNTCPTRTASFLSINPIAKGNTESTRAISLSETLIPGSKVDNNIDSETVEDTRNTSPTRITSFLTNNPITYENDSIKTQISVDSHIESRNDETTRNICPTRKASFLCINPKVYKHTECNNPISLNDISRCDSKVHKMKTQRYVNICDNSPSALQKDSKLKTQHLFSEDEVSSIDSEGNLKINCKDISRFKDRLRTEMKFEYGDQRLNKNSFKVLNHTSSDFDPHDRKNSFKVLDHTSRDFDPHDRKFSFKVLDHKSCDFDPHDRKNSFKILDHTSRDFDPHDRKHSFKVFDHTSRNFDSQDRKISSKVLDHTSRDSDLRDRKSDQELFAVRDWQLSDPKTADIKDDKKHSANLNHVSIGAGAVMSGDEELCENYPKIPEKYNHSLNEYLRQNTSQESSRKSELKIRETKTNPKSVIESTVINQNNSSENVSERESIAQNETPSSFHNNKYSSEKLCDSENTVYEETSSDVCSNESNFLNYSESSGAHSCSYVDKSNFINKEYVCTFLEGLEFIVRNSKSSDAISADKNGPRNEDSQENVSTKSSTNVDAIVAVIKAPRDEGTQENFSTNVDAISPDIKGPIHEITQENFSTNVSTNVDAFSADIKTPRDKGTQRKFSTNIDAISADIKGPRDEGILKNFPTNVDAISADIKRLKQEGKQWNYATNVDEKSAAIKRPRNEGTLENFSTNVSTNISHRTVVNRAHSPGIRRPCEYLINNSKNIDPGEYFCEYKNEDTDNSLTSEYVRKPEINLLLKNMTSGKNEILDYDHKRNSSPGGYTDIDQVIPCQERWQMHQKTLPAIQEEQYANQKTHPAYQETQAANQNT